MRVDRALVLTFLLIFGLLHVAYPQSSKGRNKYAFEKRTKGRSKSRSAIACPVFEKSKYPYQGIGLKLGDPFAITYKFYASERFAVVADFGKASSGLYNRYYREKFYEYVNVDTASEGATIDYLTHSVNSDWVAELKFLWHFDASGVTPGLKFYFGIGPEIKSTQIKYEYFYSAVINNVEVNQLGEFTRKRSTFGPQVSLGIEYSYFQIPISAFMELELFHDVSLDPGWRRFEGGAGLRYIF